MQKRLKLFFTYFGGKWRIAKHYPEPLYPSLIEPFAGSCGYSLHYPHKQVLIFDLDPIICGVWDYLIRSKESEILALPLVITDIREMTLVQEAKWLLGFWVNRATTSPCHIPSKWMRDHATDLTRLNTYWGDGVRKRIASQLIHIRHWKVKNLSYHHIENQRASWFVDPPYYVSGRRYRFNRIDYQDLGGWCQERQGQVMVCEQEPANWLPFSFFRVSKALEGKHGHKQSKEVLWYRGELNSANN